MRFIQRSLAFSIVLLLVVSMLPPGVSAEPAPDEPEPPAPTELIVRFNKDATVDRGSSRTEDGDDASPAGRLSREVERGLQSRTPLRGTDDAQVFRFDSPEAAEAALETFRSDPAVELVEPNYVRELHWAPDDNEYWEDQRTWAETMRFPEAWNITTGEPELVVAVIDSGVSPTHPDLQGKLVPGYNAVDGTDNAADIDGHGTRVAGLIAAAADNQVGIAGGAMDVKIMPIRVLGDDRSITVASIYDAIVWAVDNGADVINMSFGSDTASETERSAVQYAYESNIPMVASSGNRFNRISYPASYPETIAVGSLDANGNRSHFSSIITEVDVAAPGELLFTTGWDSTRGDHWDNRLVNGRAVEGTSFSSALVSGVVALQKSINPDITIEQVRSILTSTAIDTGEPGPEAGVGAGQVNAEASVRTVAFWSMYDTWYPTDYPVSTGSVSRTWLWGTDPPVQYAYESYAEAQHGVRLVYYYDKSRMEMTNPLEDRGERWYVTNGLLVNELVTGDMQVGDGAFEGREPANVNVAGDPDDTLGPTYASFAGVLDAPPLAQGQVIVETLSRSGEVGSDERFAAYDVWAEYLEETTNHRVADVFWNYLNSYGLVAYGDELVTDLLFEPWFYATGLPITEAYWSEVTVAGEVRDVLVQCFERRCMTYTPANDPEWRVEMGNVGQHYYAWRYTGDSEPQPDPEPEEPAEEVLYESTMTDWPEATFPGGATFSEDDAYHVQVTDGESDPVVQQAPLGEVDDAGVSVEVRMVDAEGDAEACLNFRYDQSLLSGYLWCIDSSGETVAYYQGMDSEGADTVEVLLERELREQASPVDDWTELGVVAEGEDIRFMLNGDEVGAVEHGGASSGTVGIQVTNNGDSSVEFAFRNLLVTGVAAE